MSYLRLGLASRVSATGRCWSSGQVHLRALVSCEASTFAVGLTLHFMNSSPLSLGGCTERFPTALWPKALEAL